MASPTREQVYGALLTLMQTRCGATFASYSRRVSMPNKFREEIGPLPGLMIWEHTEKTDKPGRGSPNRRTWYCDLAIVFQQTGQPDPENPGAAPPGASTLNPMIEAIEAALTPTGAGLAINAVTLGDLVNAVYIEGETHIALGDTDPSVENGQGGYGGAIIPLTILVP